MSAILHEPKKHITFIAEGESGKHTFENISSGIIPEGSHIFLLSRYLDASIGEDFFDECA